MSELVSSQSNPWHALMPLHAKDHEDREMLTLTRGEELHVAINMVATARVSLLYAASGNGKTSLINAGLIPFFRAQGYVVFIVRPRPPWAQTDPRAAFRSCVLRQLPAAVRQSFDDQELAELEELVATEKPELKPLAMRVRKWVDALPAEPSFAATIEERFGNAESVHEVVRLVAELVGPRPILLILDQFEELFVHFSNHAALTAYAEDLGRVWADPSLNARLLFSMREDWVGSMIVVRRAIPELFKDTFRLLPITAAAARLVLEKPLQSRGYAFEPAAEDGMLNDLVSDYRFVEKKRLGRVAPDDREREHRYLDASALQLVASRLWNTRNQYSPPFSAEHYRSLATPGGQDEGSPAAQYLESYLSRMLEQKDEALRRLQIDALAQLTDGERHRRASTAEAIARELGGRGRDEEKEPLTAPRVREALRPLEIQRVVRTTETDEGVEFELSHDFVVRAVTSLAHQLELKRAEEVGERAAVREKKEVRLQQLERRDDALNTVMQFAPFFGFAGLVWSALSLWIGDYGALGFSLSQLGPGILVYASFLVLGAIGVVAKHRLSMIMALIGLAMPLIVAIGIAQERVRVEAIRKSALEQTATFDERVSKTALQTDLGHVDARNAVGDLGRQLATATDPQLLQGLLRAGQRVASNLMDEPPLRTYAGSYDNALANLQLSLRSAVRPLNARTIGSSLLGLTAAAVLLIYLLSAASLSNERASRILLLMWADLVDLLTYYLPAFITFASCRLAEGNWRVGLLVSVVIVLIARCVLVLRLRTTLGLWLAGFLLEGAFRTRREILYLFWTALNAAALLPWALLAPLALFYRRALPVDLLARTVPAEKPPPAQSAAQTSAAA